MPFSEYRVEIRPVFESTAGPGPHDVLGVGEPERYEQQSGLVDVPIILVVS